MLKPEIIIVGAGPTGLTLANYLGLRGRSVLLVEANAATVGEPRAVSIDDESMRTMQDIGLLDIVRSEVVAGYGTEYWSPTRKRFLKVRPVSQPFGHPRRNAFRQPVLEAQLRRGLARFPHVHTRFGTRVEEFEERDGKVVATLLDGDGGREDVTAGYLVGADGGRSRTRQAIGAQLQGRSADERWLILDLEDAGSAQVDTVVFCDPRRPAISLPGPRETHRFEFKLFAHEHEADLLNDETVTQLLATHDAPPGHRIVRRVVYRFHALLADHWGRGRVWLAGDAAHLSPPFAGQGMNSGIRDAVNLGWKLDMVLCGDLGGGLLSTYQVERSDHVSQMIQLAERIGVVMGPPTRLVGALTRTAFRLLGIWPKARSYFAEMKYKPPPRFRGGFLLRAVSPRTSIVGRMIPQPRLREGPDRGMLLDDWLGQGFVLLGLEIDDVSLAALSLGAAWDRLVGRRRALPVAWVPELADLAGQFLLLRPDRYVLAQFVPADGERIAAELEELRLATWTDGGVPPAPAPATELVGDRRDHINVPSSTFHSC